MVAPDAKDRLADAPPSAKLVYKTLEYEGELTQGQLVDETRLSVRTVRYALRELQDRDVIREEIYFADARKRLYSLKSADEPSEPTDRA
ncbi:winged helix-turn-helix transcriptional regulator [Haloarcula nitratireducens]|uniref:Winged helix-turn-helix transcriptional regulator n=1 Tax=Haloarcula nitratireducens TaxID=2487749 RepID=A0AAW4PGU4_9EURY|nr:winged helix-turn-helix transcriptional regulator [Halomicroarcula nitratireducens]MBX0296808.1 winged helix-turn-helix transcriptional regulator [Halomicroarcula nitratireducens]